MRARELRMLRGVNHDLKNPLGAVDGYAQLLLEGVKGDLSPGQRELIVRMREATATALRLADELSQLAMMQGGRAVVAPSRVDVTAAVREVADAHHRLIEREAVTLELTLPPDLAVVRTDPAHLRTILDAMLRHAIAHAGAGGRVQLQANVRSDGADGGAARLIVEDTGPAIDAELAERFFEPFSRLDHDLARGGALELTLARASARLLGGDLTLARPIGDGTSIRMEAHIPAAPSHGRRGV